ncbi:MAG TPA: hypothetical protein PLR99_02885 [Polyangiaceae bacterium]|nr:hypothetical protein [Polyangiaceae bacterium]
MAPRTAPTTAAPSRSRRNLRSGALALVLLCAAVGGYSAGCGSDPPPANVFPPVEPPPPAGEGGPGGLFDGATSELKLKELTIVPADASLTVDLGQRSPTLPFTARGVTPEGKVIESVVGAWGFSRFDVASFTGNALTPTGFIGGKGEVTFKAGGLTATTTATVKLRMVAGETPTTAQEAAFTAATVSDPSLSVLYPYNGTVFPRGLVAPLLQWSGGSATGFYKIQAKSSTFEYTAYATVAGANGVYTFPKTPVDAWARLTDSTDGALDVTVQRYDGTTAYTPKPMQWKIAGANLKGTVYYTRLIDQAGGTFVRKLEPGGTPANAMQINGETCIACHSVSKDGSRIVGSINGGDSPWGVWDTRTGAKVYQSTQASGFQAISPDGAYVLWRHWSPGQGQDNPAELRLSTATSDAILATLRLPAGTPGGLSHPVWSPDGARVAFGVRTAGGALAYTAATLWTAKVTLGATPGFSDVKKIIDANATFPVATNPTYTPDSKFIAFMRANKARGSDADSRGELWGAGADGGGEVRFDKANGAGVLAATDRNWGPSFHPVAAGGYYWLAFYAQRNYGHRFTGQNRQMWIAAIDLNPVAGVDPSHPAFYIAGQETDATNERPQFTVPPCKPLGQTCENGYDCCDGFCRAADDGGGLVCQKPGGCARLGERCAVKADCCDQAECVGGYCTPVPK